MDIHDVQRLERVAEELMGRRKWKLYQEVLAQSHINTNSTSLAQNNTSTDPLNQNNGKQEQVEKESAQGSQTDSHLENHSKESDDTTENSQIKDPSTNQDETENHQSRQSVTTDIEGGEVKILDKNSSDNKKGITVKSDEELLDTRPPKPVDWRPQDKCYFCVDGKLLAVNERGELVAESGPVNAEPDLANTTPLDSDSESSESCSEAEVQNPAAAFAATQKSLAALLRGSGHQNMTSLESMAAQLAAVASLQGIPGAMPGIPSLYQGLWYHQQLSQQMPHVGGSAGNSGDLLASGPSASGVTTSPTMKATSSPSEVISNSEQPLDLSAKSSLSSSSAMDPKHIFKAKPRMSAVAGRRTYTEDELQNALQDILSGKLGTRRAAVLYGIPRSTLRNKVYKLAMEQKREANIHPLVAPVLDLEDEDKDLSGGEDEKEVEKALRSMPSTQEELLRLPSTQSLVAAASMQKYGKLYDGASSSKSDTSSDVNKAPPTPTTPQMPQLPTTPWLDPNVLLQSLLLTGGLGALPGLMQMKSEDGAAAAAAVLPELLRTLMLQQQELMKKQIESTSQASTSDHLNNGKPPVPDPRLLMQNLSLSQTHQPTSPYLSRTGKTEIPESARPNAVTPNDSVDDPAVILKIPSYKPVAGSSTPVASVGKNGDSTPQSQTAATTPIHSRSPQQSHLGISPPLMRPSSESQSPPMMAKGTLSLRDVIAQSISKNFQQQHIEPPAPPPLLKQPEHSDLAGAAEQYKRPTISVIKNLGGSFGGASLMGNSASAQSATGTGGKGTRPKRGKYRNYDRDSLVEAVKAVQRGEMSVHRAGSYYGVPHSTLEYKVKERHLMRPRKREPKPQPMDDRSLSGSSVQTNTKSSDIPSAASMRSGVDKSKVLPTTKPPMKTPPFPGSPNGLKMPFIDPAMAAQFQYTSPLFWPHPSNFGGLPMDFTRTPGPSSFPPNAADNFYASHIIQRIQEQSVRHQNVSGSVTASSSTPSISSKNIHTSAPPSTSLPKTARELAESLYDGANANGSFLDGIIRHSLDRKPSEMPHGALLDHLVKNSLQSTSTSDEGGSVGATKRSASPTFGVHEVKKERKSPLSLVSGTSSSIQDKEHSSIFADMTKESVDNLLKLREGLSLRRNSTEDHNGSTTSTDDKLKMLSSENEDSS